MRRRFTRFQVAQPFVAAGGGGGGGTVWGSSAPNLSANAVSNYATLVISDGGRTLFNPSLNIQATIRATTTKATGKFYYEIVWTTGAGTTDVGLGYIGVGSQPANYWQSNSDELFARGNGQVFYDGVNFAGGSVTFTSGDTVGFAVDVGVGVKIYVNNVLKLTFSHGTTPIAPACWLDNGSGMQQYTLKCSAADCTYSPPAGYANWD